MWTVYSHNTKDWLKSLEQALGFAKPTVCSNTFRPREHAVHTVKPVQFLCFSGASRLYLHSGSNFFQYGDIGVLPAKSIREALCSQDPGNPTEETIRATVVGGGLQNNAYGAPSLPPVISFP
jgi:ethanolamine utilization protein EutA (predicted chaperonin)